MGNKRREFGYYASIFLLGNEYFCSSFFILLDYSTIKIFKEKFCKKNIWRYVLKHKIQFKDNSGLHICIPAQKIHIYVDRDAGS